MYSQFMMHGQKNIKLCIYNLYNYNNNNNNRLSRFKYFGKNVTTQIFMTLH